MSAWLGAGAWGAWVAVVGVAVLGDAGLTALGRLGGRALRRAVLVAALGVGAR